MGWSTHRLEYSWIGILIDWGIHRKEYSWIGILIDWGTILIRWSTHRLEYSIISPLQEDNYYQLLIIEVDILTQCQTSY
jgi:hypothetical protein